jgi:hypothetical protein
MLLLKKLFLALMGLCEKCVFILLPHLISEIFDVSASWRQQNRHFLCEIFFILDINFLFFNDDQG